MNALQTSTPLSTGRASAQKRRWWKLSLGVWSLLAVGGGSLIGWLAPDVGEGMKILGDIFLNLVQMVVIPLVFPLIVLGISRMESVKKVGRVAGKAILYFEVVTTIILVMAVALAKFTNIGVGAPVSGGSKAELAKLSQGIDFRELILHAVPDNIFAAVAEGNLLGTITFAVFVGIGMAALGSKVKPVEDALDGLAQIMFQVVGYVIRFAPIGILGFISYDVAHYGFANLSTLLGFIAVVYAGLAIILCVIFPLIGLIFRVRYVALMRSIAGLVGIAFITRSSESVLAPLLEKLEKFGLNRSTSSFVVPLGYSFNTDGSVLYQAVALVFISNAYGLHTDVLSLLLMVGVLVVLSKGMAGVASGSIVVLIAAGHTLGLPPQGVALLLGVDFIVDMARTAVNVVGNSLAACVIDRSERKAALRERNKEVAGSAVVERASDTSASGMRVPQDEPSEVLQR